jgi:hypothetical protein
MRLKAEATRERDAERAAEERISSLAPNTSSDLVKSSQGQNGNGSANDPGCQCLTNSGLRATRVVVVMSQYRQCLVLLDRFRL